MPIEVGNIKFGEIDAKNEIFDQNRMGSSIFRNAFQIPPGIDVKKILLGSKYFIYGQKGCGKTALLLYSKFLFDEGGANTDTILFKSDITEPERQRIAVGKGFEIVSQSDLKVVEYDYKINWLWYIYRNLIRGILPDQVIQNAEILDSIKKLLNLKNELRSSALSDLSTKKIQGHAKAGLKAGPFHAEIGAEIEAISEDTPDSLEIEIIEIVERYISKVALHPKKRRILLFDELELFWNKPDQRERDLYLIRDLLYAVSRVNRNLGAHSASMIVIASVRSEVLHEVNRVGPEISRDVDDFGVKVNWNVNADDDQQPILKIVEAKINASEVENESLPTEDVWTSYFPSKAFGRNFKRFILDNAMFKPRNIVNLLTLATERRPEDTRISSETIDQVQLEFSRRTWREIEEELSGEYSGDDIGAIKSILTGFDSIFNIDRLQSRINHVANYEQRVRAFSSKYSASHLINSLYRVGAIGNHYHIGSKSKKREVRFGWIFRDNYDPLFDRDFMVHESLRKMLQLSFRDGSTNHAK